jgi:hypothetical protein
MKLDLNLNIVVSNNRVCVYDSIGDLAIVDIEDGSNKDLAAIKAVLKALRMAVFAIEKRFIRRSITI